MELDRIPKIVQRQPELVSGHRGVGVVGGVIPRMVWIGDAVTELKELLGVK